MSNKKKNDKFLDAILIEFFDENDLKTLISKQICEMNAICIQFFWIFKILNDANVILKP